jgi:HEAT repeat protein
VRLTRRIWLLSLAALLLIFFGVYLFLFMRSRAEMAIIEHRRELVRELAYGSDRESTAARLELLDLGESAIPFLEEGIENPDPKIRAATVFLAGKYYRTHFEQKVRNLLNDPDKDVRWSAINVLVEWKDPSAYDILVQCMISKDYPLDWILWRFSRLKDPRSVPILLGLLSKELPPHIVREALYALAEIGDARSFPPILQALSEMQVLSKKQNPNVLARAAIRALANTGGVKAVPYLLQFLSADQPSDIIREAIDGLVKIGDAEAIPHLRRIAREHPEDFIRGYALEAIMKMGAAP